MLASSYKFIIDNQLDQVLTVDVNVHPWKFNTTTGALEYGAQINRLVTSVAPSGQVDVGLSIDNTGDLYLGAHCSLGLSTTGTGDCYLYLLNNNGAALRLLMAAETDPETTGIINFEI